MFKLVFLLVSVYAINYDEVQKVVAQKWINAINFPDYFNLTESFEINATIDKCGANLTAEEYKKSIKDQQLFVTATSILIDSEVSFKVNYFFYSTSASQNEKLRIEGVVGFRKLPLPNANFLIYSIYDRCFKSNPQITQAPENVTVSNQY